MLVENAGDGDDCKLKVLLMLECGAWWVARGPDSTIRCHGRWRVACLTPPWLNCPDKGKNDYITNDYIMHFRPVFRASSRLCPLHSPT